ncbi:hypothetical protein ABID59_000001, partial [Bradyrhizobium sp. S3.3.6]
RQPHGYRQLTSPALAGERGDPPPATPRYGTRSPPFLFWSSISMRTVSLSTDSLIAMVPDKEWRIPILMVPSPA